MVFFSNNVNRLICWGLTALIVGVFVVWAGLFGVWLSDMEWQEALLYSFLGGFIRFAYDWGRTIVDDGAYSEQAQKVAQRYPGFRG